MLSAQQSDFMSKVRFGGGIGLGFANDFFSASLEPSAIYQFNQQFAFGAGLNFTYNSQKDFYKSTIFGGTLTALYNPIPYLQLSADFQELHVSRKFDNNFFYQDDDYWYPALLLGLGFQTNHVTMGVRYDVLYDDNKSIYGSAWVPFVRVYF
ncbi:alpha-ketoglutarate decarboxylase [Formosa sp. S-31]